MGAAPPPSSRLIPPAAFQVWDGRGGGRRGRKWVVVTRKGNPSLAVVLILSSCFCFCSQGNRRGRMVCEKCELRGHIFGRRRLGEANWSSLGTSAFLFWPQVSDYSLYLSTPLTIKIPSLPNDRIVVLHSEWSQFCTHLFISFASPTPNPGFHPTQFLTGSFAPQTLKVGMGLKSNLYNI